MIAAGTFHPPNDPNDEQGRPNWIALVLRFE